MGKHTVLALFAALVIALGLVGCGSSGMSASQSAQSSSSASSEATQQSQESASSSSSTATPQNPDEELLPELTAGLEARWKLADQTKDQETTVQLRKKLVDAELEHLAAFKGATFKDANLGELAERYIAALDESVACLDSYDTHFTDFAKRWSDAYKERTLIIKDLVDNYGLKVADQYQESLDAMIENAKTAEAEQLVPMDIRQTADEDIPAAVVSAFQKTDGNTYRATVVNPSRATFDYYNLAICLLDAKGGLIEEQTITINDWASGAEAVFEFTPSSEFASIDAYPENWWATWQN